MSSTMIEEITTRLSNKSSIPSDKNLQASYFSKLLENFQEICDFLLTLQKVFFYYFNLSECYFFFSSPYKKYLKINHYFLYLKQAIKDLAPKLQKLVQAAVAINYSEYVSDDIFAKMIGKLILRSIRFDYNSINLYTESILGNITSLKTKSGVKA